MEHSSTMHERRWNDRMPVDLNVELYYQGELFERCRTRDLGIKGMFLWTEFGTPPTGRLVELVFKLPNNGDTEHHVTAQVMYHCDDGAGLMFNEFDPDTICHIGELLGTSKAA